MDERGDNDRQAVLSRLLPVLEGMHGKLRVVDALALAGFARPSNARAKLVAGAMRALGWDRRRLRFDGALCYAYARGSQLEREVVLDVQRGEDGQLVVKRRELL
jgi:hypothetical protein